MTKEAKSRIDGREITWTDVDIDIVRGLADGLDDQEIARKNGMSLQFLRSSKKSLSTKFGGIPGDALGIAIAHAIKLNLIDPRNMRNVSEVELDAREASALADLMTNPQDSIGLSTITSAAAMISVREKFRVKTNYQAVAAGAFELKLADLI